MPETDLCQYWPPWFREILDFQALCRTEGEELRVLAAFMSRIHRNLFVQTMDEGATAAWEAIFHIVPNPVTETLAFRRDRILNRLSMHPPFTLPFLYQRLDALFGPGNWEVEMDYPSYTLYIEAAVEDQQYFSEMSVTMELIKPCHIVYISRPRVAAAFRLSETVVRYHAQYNYILGSWGLGLLPFVTQGEKETVKMASQPSIQQVFLDQAAGFVASDIKSVRINGEILITALSKSTVGNVASVGYRVLREQTEQVTLIELLDRAGTVLTTSAVQVPVVEEAVAFRHAFIVKEGD